MTTVKDLINELRSKRKLTPLNHISDESRLLQDLGLDSLDLAVLAIRLDETFSVDIFSGTSRVQTVGDIRNLINDKK